MKANRVQAREHQSVHGSRQEYFLSLERVKSRSIGEGTRRGEISGELGPLYVHFQHAHQGVIWLFILIMSKYLLIPDLQH